MAEEHFLPAEQTTDLKLKMVHEEKLPRDGLKCRLNGTVVVNAKMEKNELTCLQLSASLRGTDKETLQIEVLHEKKVVDVSGGRCLPLPVRIEVFQWFYMIVH